MSKAKEILSIIEGSLKGLVFDLDDGLEMGIAYNNSRDASSLLNDLFKVGYKKTEVGPDPDERWKEVTTIKIKNKPKDFFPDKFVALLKKYNFEYEVA